MSSVITFLIIVFIVWRIIRRHKKHKVMITVGNVQVISPKKQAKQNRKNDDRCVKSKQGLKISEILLLFYCSYGNYPKRKSEYPRMWFYDYGVADVDKALKSLRRRGFIRFSTSTEMLPDLKVDELRKICKDFNLDPKGKKPEMIQAISESVPDSKLSRYIVNPTYTLTEKGQGEISANQYVIYFHKNKPMIDLWEFNRLRSENPNTSDNDLMWSEFNRLLLENMKDGNIGTDSVIRRQMADLLYYEGKFSRAADLLLQVCFNDINNSDNRSSYDEVSELLNRHTIQLLADCCQKKQISSEALYQKANDAFVRMSASNRLLSNESTASLIVKEVGAEDLRRPTA